MTTNRVDLCSLHVPCRQHPSDTDSLDTVTTEFVDSLATEDPESSFWTRLGSWVSGS